MIDLATPWALALLPLPLLARWLLPPATASDANSAALRVPFFDQLGSVGFTDSAPAGGRWRRHVALLIWLLLLLAAAAPRWQGEAQSLPVSGRDLLLAVDISGSMEQPDLNQGGRRMTRLAAVKQVARRFIEQRQGDRVGLILFGSQAYLQTPLTFDRDTVATLLDEAQIGLAGKETAIGDAIGLAIKRLKDQRDEASQRVLILLTDGANTAGEVDPRHAAQLAADNDIRIHTVGIGAERRRNRSARFGAAPTNPAMALDEQTLQFISQNTGGVYFRARDIEGLEQVYADLDQLEPTVRDYHRLRPIVSLFHWPLALALALSILLAIRPSPFSSNAK